MRAAEQESLLLRRVAALRRSGVSHSDALRHAAEGLPPGRLSVRVSAALQALSSGAAGAPDPLLSSGEAPVDALEHAARAIDAGLSAEAALALTRLYLTLALAGPLVLGSLLAWLSPDLIVGIAESQPGTLPGSWVVMLGIRSALQYAGLPVAAVLAMVILRGGARLAPGVDRIRQAAVLLNAAADGRAEPLALTHPLHRTYLDTRAPAVGAPRAAAELADELVREGEAQVALFRHLAPLAAAVIAGVLLLPGLVLFGLPILSMGAM